MPVYPDEPKIPILPNLLTAGNLLCGFFSILTIFKGMAYPDGSLEAFEYYQQATYFIFAACIFDLLDGRVARLCKCDGPFGREFDSIADVVSFGIAPALLLARAAERKISQEELMEALWGPDAHAESRALWTLISRLRKKLNSQESRLEISSLRGGGYLLEQL